MSIIWKLLKKTIYDNIDDFIREVDNKFIVSSLWILFNGLIILFLIWLGFKIYADWRIGVWIVGIYLGIEFLHWFGEKLQK